MAQGSKDFVYNNLAGKTAVVYNNGKAETVYFAKSNDMVVKNSNNNSVKVIDELENNKAKSFNNMRNLSIIHIDELL